MLQRYSRVFLCQSHSLEKNATRATGHINVVAVKQVPERYAHGTGQPWELPLWIWQMKENLPKSKTWQAYWRVYVMGRAAG
jgi:hypothetical protein